MSIVAQTSAPISLAPNSLKDAPSFIERQFPVGRLSAEAFKERTAKQAQTLTQLGAYWKGRKPLVLVRAVILGCLLPATDDPAADLDMFLKLMAMDDAAFARRFDGSAGDFSKIFPAAAAEVATNRKTVWLDKADLTLRETWGEATNFLAAHPERAAKYTEVVTTYWRWREEVTLHERRMRIAAAFATLPYKERQKHVRRPEECDERELLGDLWPEVNGFFGTQAQSLPEFVEQLGIARFGHRTKLADTFCGGGSIPFEAARLGCDVYASDLNPVACMLTWGAFNIIGASKETRAEIETAQRQVAALVDAEITRLGIEHNTRGDRAKNFLYALEARCPRTGWLVPLAPSWVITKDWNVVAKLVPDHNNKRYHILIESGVSANEMALAEQGTVREGRLVHPMNPDRSGVDIKTLRGDFRSETGENKNKLRRWSKLDFAPQIDDIFQERLYCIQWITKESLLKGRQETFFAAIDGDDIAREEKVDLIVKKNLANWQNTGLVPEIEIKPGDKTDEPIRTRGWTHWHHLFSARQLLFFSLLRTEINKQGSAAGLLDIARLLDRSSKLPKWSKSNGSGGQPTNVFDNQALNPQTNYGSYASTNLLDLFIRPKAAGYVRNPKVVRPTPAVSSGFHADIFVTDPPYADAVNYHEITEFFIAWLRKNPPPPFDQWTWDSQREKAIKGKDENFRRDMVAAYAAMTQQMPDNGQQVVMFTHQDAGVWADLGAILWAAGLRVTAAWNVVTETESALKEGNYVQGTVCLVLRKRLKDANARRMEIEAEIEDAVRAQVESLTALDDAWHARADAEQLYTDGDLTLAAYAAALQVVTGYSTIDRQPLDRDLYRKLAKNESTVLRDLVLYAAQVANGLLVPSGFSREKWLDLKAPERFYVRMLDMEAKGSAKYADFQNFARSFAFADYQSLMASTTANAASLAGAADLKGRQLDGEGFAKTQLRQVLFAIWKTMEGKTPDPKKGVTILKTEYAADFWTRRQNLIGLADYVALKTKTTRPEEGAAAGELAEALRNERV